MGKNNKFIDSKKLPLVTVYITNYNYGKYIDQSIKSVLNQTLQNFELIIIDDGSKDGSRNIINKYKNNSKVIIIFQKNKGLIVSNNLALRLAKGKYLMRLDSDDWLDTNALEIMSNFLERNEKVGLVFPDYHEVDINGDIIRTVQRHNFKKVKMFDQPSHGACTMIRKENLKNIGGYDEEFNCQDGYYLWLQFVKKYLVRNINLPLFYYRQHEKNLSKNVNKILFNRSKIINKFYKQEKKEKNNKKNILAIVPIRGLKVNPYSYVLQKIRKTPLVFYTIETLIKCNSVKKIIITSPDQKLLSIIKKKFNSKKIIYIIRPLSLSKINTEKEKTFKYVLKQKKIKKIKHDYVLDMSYYTPYLSVSSIETALNTLRVFKADMVIPVIEEINLLFKHDGTGLKRIIKNSNLKLERDLIFKQIYGFNLFKKSKIFKDLEDLKISHIILSSRESIEAVTDENIKLLNSI